MDPRNYSPDLMWIDYSEVNSLRRVRAHVVRDRRRRASWEEKKIMESLQKRLQVSKTISVDTPSDSQDPQHNIATVYSELLSGGRRDPFVTYPVESTTNMLELLDYFLYSLKVHRQTLYQCEKDFTTFKQLVYSTAVNDVAGFHLLLFWAASDKCNLYEKGDLTSAIKHKMAALRILNVRMSEVTQATMDGTVGTVTAAAGFELFLGTLEAYQVHMNGLQQIIRLRGGFQSLQVANPELALFIAWVDYSGAANLVNKRSFLPVPAQHQQQVSSPILQRFDLHRNLSETIQIVNNVTLALQAGQIKLPLELRSIVALDNLDQELYRLFSLPKYCGMIGRRLFIQEVWRITALIFISVICRLNEIDPRLPTNTPTRLLLDRLRPTADDYYSFIETLIRSFTDNPKRLDLLMTRAICLTLDDWSHIKLKLLSFLLSDEICRGPLQEIWRGRLALGLIGFKSGE